MATEILDLRRTDERNTYLHHPTWLEMAAIKGNARGKAAILMSFPATKGVGFLIHELCCRIVTPFVSATSAIIIVGNHTIATEDAVDGDTATVVDTDAYMEAGDMSEYIAGIYFPRGGAFVTQLAAATTYTRPSFIVGSDATVTCISAELSCTSIITAGEARVYALVSTIQGT